MTNLVSQDGVVEYLPSFLSAAEADDFFQQLMVQLPWQEENLIIAGRPVRSPRLVSWHGDVGANFRYSGRDHLPKPWNDLLIDLKTRVEQQCAQPFNSVLGNLYRNGRDSVGWHADNESVLGVNPCIASLSFGAQRHFKLRHKRTGENLSLDLVSGSLLIMAGPLQHHWRHCVPKEQAVNGARINLTFRNVALVVE